MYCTRPLKEVPCERCDSFAPNREKRGTGGGVNNPDN